MHLTPIGDGALLLEPGVALDPSEPDHYLTTILELLAERGCQRLIYDLRECVVVDEIYYGWLTRLASACRICGVEMVVANVQPAAAYTLARRLSDDPPFRCFLDVDRARCG